MNNVIESYLVSLGFAVDQPELAKFKRALKDASDTAEHHTSGIIGQFVKWQGAIVGAFAAVGLGTIGMMSHVADADLKLQIFAQKMFLPVKTARELTNALDILGMSLEDASWNPEARGRLPGLMGEMAALEKGLGPGFEQTMMKVRSVTIEFRTWEKVLSFIQMSVTDKLFRALGGDSILEKIRGWTDWFIKNAPKISDWITARLVPLMKDAWHVLGDVWRVVEKLAQAFVRLIGAFSGDKNLKDGALTFDNIGKAIDKAADYMVRFVDAVTSAELVVIDLFDALVDLLHLDFKDFAKDIGAAKGDLTEGGAIVGGLGILGALLGVATVGGLVKFGLGIGRTFIGAVLEGMAGEAAAGAAVGEGVAAAGAAGAAGGAGILAGAAIPLAVGAGAAYGMNKLGVADWIDRHLAAMGINPVIGPNIFDGSGAVDPAVVGAVAKQESGGHQIDPKTGKTTLGPVTRSGERAIGMMQLMPETAAKLGVNPYDEKENIEGGTRLLSMLFKKYGDLSEVLAAYNWGEGNLDAALKRHGGQFSLDYLPKETRDYVSRIEGQMGGGGVQVGEVHVHVNSTNASVEQIKKATTDGIQEASRRSNRKDIVNAQGVYA